MIFSNHSVYIEIGLYMRQKHQEGVCGTYEVKEQCLPYITRLSVRYIGFLALLITTTAQASL